MLDEDIRDFNAQGKPPIPEVTLNRSIHRLQVIGALSDDEQMTKLGRRMAKYPASPEHQRCMVEAESHGVQTRLAMAAMVAAAEVGGLRLFEQGSASWEQLTDETSSDFFAQLEMFIAIKRRRVNETMKDDLDRNNIIRADELYRKLVHRSGIDDIPQLKVPGVEERKILRECIVRGFAHSAFLPAGDGMFKAVGGALRLREVSNRSVVSATTRHAVVGRPFDIQIERDGGLERKPIIEMVTEVSIRELGKYAVDLTRWQHIGFSLRGKGGNRFFAVEEQVLGRQVISRREVPALPSPLLRAAVMEHVKVQPGEHLRALYAIKSDTERLDRRSKTPVSRLTQDAIDELIDRAAPDDVDSPDHVEDNLRQLIVSEQISLDRYVSPEQREKIMQDAPDIIEADGYTLKLQYVERKPVVRKATEDVILGLHQQPSLPDGRPVLFMYDNKRLTWSQARKLLIGTGEL
jgi:HrpA-like RNA helicase